MTKFLGNLVTLNVVVGVLFAAVSFMFMDDILLFFGASENTLPFARDYMEVILLGNVITHLYFGINAALRSSGHPQQAMTATIMTVVMNAVLTPIFIFVFGMGIRGAALATILAQFVTLMWQTKLLSNPNELLHLQRGIYRLRGDIVKRVLRIGMSPFLINTAACMVVIIINKGLRSNSDNGDLSIAAYGIANRMQFIFVMIVLGLTQGMQPIAGYNYGAQQYSRVTQVLKLAIWGGTAMTTLTFLVGEFMPEVAVSLFTTDEGLIARASEGFRIVVLVFPIVGFQMVTSNFFQSIGMANKAIFLSLTRQLLFLLPCLIILPKFMGAAGIWWSMPISDVISSIVAAVLLYKQYQAFKAHNSRLKNS